MARQFTRGRGRAGSPRLTVWAGLPAVEVTLAAANSSALIISLGAAGLALRPFTIIRTRGIFFARSDQTAALENYGVAFGGAVVSDQASAIGVTAVPTPDTDRDSDLFFLYEEIAGTFGFISGTGARDIGHLRSFDSKAMRKVEEGQDIVFTLENTSVSLGSLSRISGRVLLKLH